MEDKSNKNEGYSSIVAASSGIVDKIMTRSGTPLVRPGDEVEKRTGTCIRHCGIT